MARVKVKICGIKNIEEASAAVDAGADALGFNFWSKSPRYVSPDDARRIIEEMDSQVSGIGVFVNEGADRIIEIATTLGLDGVQLHGDESPEFCERLGWINKIKAVRVGEDFDVVRISDYPVKMILLDTRISGAYGGTGRRFDWRVAEEAKRHAPIILAGGITIDNVGDAIRQVRPIAIDVCSGVEAEPGTKDLTKLRIFMKKVSEANGFEPDRELDNRGLFN